MRPSFAIVPVAVATMIAVLAPLLFAGEIGHFNPGVVNIRDYVMPEPGFYGALYNYFYTTGQLNDRHGNEVESVTLPANRQPGRPSVTLRLNLDVDLYAVAPTLMWVSNWKPLGARYAAYVVPTFANTSLGAALSEETGHGVNPSTSSYGIGDMYVQPLWLDWTLEHFDFAFGAGFYAPTGKYDVHAVSEPRIPPIKVESASNIGFGFWTEQTQVSGAWYPWAHKGTAVVLAVTHEVNGKKEDFDLTPGQNLTFNWGVSQYLPLDPGKTLLLEVGPAGYDTWQVSHDTGSDAATPNVLDQVHAAGGQLGLTYVPWGALLNFHAFQEFAAQNRFQGEVFGLNLAKKF
jgi:hypothetical protein